MKIWILYPLSGGLFEAVNLEGANKGSMIVRNLFQNSWKIFIQSAATVQTQMKFDYVMEIQEYSAMRDGRTKKGGVDMSKKDYGSSQGEMKTLPENSCIQNFYHSLQTFSQKRFENSENLNLLDFLNIKKNLNYFNKSIIEKFSFKLRFSLQFFFSVLKLRQNFEQSAFSYYNKVPLIQTNETEITQTLEEIFYFLQNYPVEPQHFITQYLQIILNNNLPYHYTTFRNHAFNKFLNLFVFSSLESEVRVIIKEFVYELYDFESGTYSTLEEAVFKVLNNFPTEDPNELLGIHFNFEIL
jgi:hypothetical protein